MTRARARALTRYTERLLGSPSLPPPPLDTPPLYKLQRVTLLQPPNFAVDPKTSFTLELVHRQAAPPPEASSRASSRDSVGDAAPADAAPDPAVTSPAWRSWKVTLPLPLTLTLTLLPRPLTLTLTLTLTLA